MDDDFNTPEALAVLQTLAREVNSAKAAGDTAHAAALGAELTSLGAVLGMLTVTPGQWFRLAKPAEDALQGSADVRRSITDQEVERRIGERAAARRARNWPESDRIRDELAASGIILEDKPGGETTWRRA